MSHKEYVRYVLKSYLNLSYRLTMVSNPNIDKQLFIKVVANLAALNQKRGLLIAGGISTEEFEELHFTIIEALLAMVFNKHQIELIDSFLFNVFDDPNWDGTLTLKIGKKDRTFKIPLGSRDIQLEALWKSIQELQ